MLFEKSFEKLNYVEETHIFKKNESPTGVKVIMT